MRGKNMETFEIFRDLAIIILVAKIFGLLARKLNAPEVAGEIVAGLLLGPAILGLIHPSEFIFSMAEIGVVLLMFSAGLETNLKEMVKTGPVAVMIALAGVFIPLFSGAAIYMLVYGVSPWGSDEFYTAVFIGVILTATSVSITVQTLKELGKLKGKVGTTIINAAIIDDIIGIIVLTVVIGLRDPETSVSAVVINTGLFFVVSIVVGFVSYKAFKLLDNKYPHTRRIPIIGLAYCLFFAYVAEAYFGIADITGAYMAGVILCSIKDSEYIAQKMDINSYMIFGPIFFISIGLNTTDFAMEGSLVLFMILFIVVGIVSKILGCGLVAKCAKFNWNDSFKIGMGMACRGEVALIVAQKGLDVGILDPKFFSSIILLIIISSILTPVTLKVLYAKDKARAE